MSDIKLQVDLSVEAESGLATVDKFGKSFNKMARESAQEAEKTAVAVGKIGEKIDFSAEKVNRQERSIVDSIKRTTTQFELLGKTASQKLEFKINEKGLDPTKFEPMLAKLREVEAQVARTAATASSSFDKMGASSISASDAWARMTVVGLGIGAVIGTIGAVTKGLYEASVAAERLKIGLDFASGGNGKQEIAYVTDLSNKLGLSLQSTASSYMSFSAASRGTALEGAAAKNVFEAVTKASAVMGLTTEQSSGALLALQQMMSKGTVQAEELRGQLGERLPGAFQIAARSMGVTTQELGKMLETGQILASDFLPKFAAQLENEIGGGAEKAAMRLGAATNRMETALFRLKVALGETGVSEWFASGVNRNTSVLNVIASEVEKFNSQGALRKASADVIELHNRQTTLRNGMANGYFGAKFQPELDAVSAKLEIAKQKFREVDKAARDALAGSGGGRGAINPTTTNQLYAKDAAAKAERDAYYAQDVRQTKDQIRIEEIGKARKANALLIAKAEGDTNEVLKLQKALQTEIANIQDKYKDKKVAGASRVDPLIDILAGISERTAASKMELEQGEKLTTNQKAAVKILDDLRTGTLKLTDAKAALLGKVLAENLQADALNIKRQELLKSQQEFEKSRDKELSSLGAEVVKINEKAQAVEDEVAMYGMGQRAIESLSIARLEEKKAVLMQFEGSAERIALLDQEIEARKRLAVANDAKTGLDEGKRAAKEAAAEWKRTAESIENSLTDALMRGFESGKSFAMVLRDTVVNMFKTMVLRPVIQATVQGGMNAVGMGGSGSAGGGILGMANNASSLNTLYGAGSQALYGASAGASGLSLAGANAVGMVGGDSLGALIAANGNWAGVGAAVGTSAASAASAAIAANVAMEAGTGVALASGTGAAASGAAPALAGMGPYGWAALAALAVVSLFGGDIMGGKKEVTGKGIEGNFSGTGFNGSSFVNNSESGGWFGSDKNERNFAGLDTATSNKFSTAYFATQQAAIQSAKALGLSADAIENFSQRISIVLTDDAAANEKAIAAVFSDLGNNLAAAVAPGLSALAKDGETAGATLTRLSGSLTTANTWLGAFGHTLFEVSLAGGDMASKLADTFGGIDNLTASSKSFYELYYSEAERTANSQIELGKALATVGLALPETKDGFRALANSIDLTTTAGRQAYAVMLSVAPEFAATTDAVQKLAVEANKALDDLFTKFTSSINAVIDSITSERAAVANAVLQINKPGVMTKDAIERGIAGTSLATPSNAGLSSAQTALAQADAKVAAQAAAVAIVKAQSPSSVALDSAKAALNAAKSATNAAQAGVDQFRAYGNDNFNWFMDMALQGNDLRGTVPNPSGERNAQNAVFNLQDAQRNQQPAQAAYDAQLASYSGTAALSAAQVADAQAKLTAATAEQAAAVTAAKTAQLAYIASLQDFAIDASKAVTKLGTLREETLKYYDAQKQLADLMTASASGLRGAVDTARNGQLDPAQSLAQQQGVFSTAYSMALATTGATQAGYADKLTAALPGLSTALMDTASTREDWASATGTLFAQSEAIAKQLEANAPQNYAADSLAMLGQIDAALAVLDASSKSAEKIIADAVTAGSENTANGLRAVIAALTGKSVPAFALGGSFGGGLRIVGENGPELEATGPSRIFNANQTRNMLGGGSDEMIQELRALREEVAGLRFEARSTAGHTSETARLLNRVIPEGDALATRAIA